jgi:acetyl-CoA acetyltransferase
MPARELSSKVAVVGVGCTRFGKLPEYDAYDLGAWAFKEALADSGLELADIDGLLVDRIHDYQRFGEMLGLNPRFATIPPGQGAS